jgi:5-methylthioadenosine/S-adenosylhomocysteine deaminase
MTPHVWDTLIVNGLIVTGLPDRQTVDHGFVAVKDGAVVMTGPRDGLPKHVADRTIDAKGCLVMPGLVNTHVHTPMSVFRGLADDLPLMTWLNDHIFPAEARHVDEDLAYWGARLAMSEMLLSGTTGLADGYFFEDRAARAALDIGIRAVAGQGVIDFPAPGVPDPGDNVAHARRFVEKWNGVSPLVSPSVFCHSPYTCSPETLCAGKDLAGEFNLLFQIHVAETLSEVERIQAEHGMTPLEYLDSLGVLDENTLVVHAVHVTEAEIDLLVERRAPVSVCVESQAKLASGIAPVHRFSDRGVRVSLGTDGPASNNDLNMFGEMRLLALLAKVRNADPTRLPAAAVLDMAVRGGASALGWSGRVGVLAPGYRADIVIMDLSGPHLHPLYHPESHLVYSATGREVRTVMVDGRVLVDEGRLTSIDPDETLVRVRALAKKIMK